MDSIITICIPPKMAVEVTTKYDQLIFSNIWDKGDQILKDLYFLSSASPCCGAHVDTIAMVHLPISSFIIINLSFKNFTSKILSIHFPATSIPAPPRPKLFPTQYILYSLFFLVINLADTPLPLTSCTQHTSRFLLVTGSTTSVWTLMAPVMGTSVVVSKM